MKIAVIKTGGKQYKVAEGDVIEIEKISDKKEGDKIKFDDVLLQSDGKKVEVGAPNVSGKSVEGEVVELGRQKKIPVIRFMSKSRHRIERGHRQHYAKIRITKV